MRTGKLTKSNINNLEYNKYLRMEGAVNISIDYPKSEAEATLYNFDDLVSKSENDERPSVARQPFTALS